jgi:hypothetical protein
MKNLKPKRKKNKKVEQEPASKKTQEAATATPNGKPSIKELLLSGPKFDNLIIPRRKRCRRRPPIIFD